MEERSLAGESALVIPDAALPLLHARRGGAAVPVPKVSDSAVKRMAAKVKERRSYIDRALHNEKTDARVAERARAYLDGTADPLGAAAVAALAVRWPYWSQAALRNVDTCVDAWVAEHGLAFAVRSFVEVLDLAGENHDGRPGWARPLDQGGKPLWDGEMELTAGRRLRALLAAADDDAYREAEAALEEARTSRRRRLGAAYLMPSRRDWVEECVAAPPADDEVRDQRLLLCSVTAADLGALGGGEPHWTWAQAADVVWTLVEGAGTRAAPLLARAADDLTWEEEGHNVALAALAVLPSDDARAYLVDRIEDRGARLALLAAADRFPVGTARVLARSAGDSPRAAALLSAHLRRYPELASGAATGLTGDVRAVIASLATAEAPIPDAPREDLPALLADPPWTRPDADAEPVVIKGLKPPQDRTVSWAEGEREEWAAGAWTPAESGGLGWETRLDNLAKSRGGRLWHPREIQGVLLNAPEDKARTLLSKVALFNTWETTDWIKPIAARFGGDMLPALLDVARSSPVVSGSLLLPFLDAGVARVMAEWNRRRKLTRGLAREWFGRHGLAAVPMLVPAALGKPGAARADAEAALRLVASAHGTGAVVEAARTHGDEAAEAVEGLLGVDPAAMLPPGRPRPPVWARAHLLPRVLLRGRRRALPLEATDHLLTMLAASRPDEVHPGVETVREVCDPEALAGFGWALFEAWQEAGMPSEHAWAFHQLGWLGDDGTVRRLTPVIRAWPGQAAHHRAVEGLDVLAAIGTDTALMHLHGIAQRVKFKGLKNAAQKKITEVAERLGLGPEQLADRLVPDFGLDADGSMTLDYGPRRFTVGFDEALRPYVVDQDGKRRKTLPKPGAKDDQEKAPAAYKRFSELKKDVRKVASDQVARLESAMVSGRRWTPEEFRRLFVEHPLIWHVARRLVWAAEAAGGQASASERSRGDAVAEAPRGEGAVTFRIAEDRTFADIDDDALTLPDDCRIFLPHPVLMDEADRTAWGEILADYEIIQPFRQLARPLHTLTDEERASGRLTRFEGVTVPVHAVLGLVRRGWDRGVPLDNGVERWISRRVAPDRYVIIDLDHGISVGAVEHSGPQTLRAVWLGDTPDDFLPRREIPYTFDELSPVMVSEVLDDLIDLTTDKGTGR